MSYFTEVQSYETYADSSDDFHFIYNANTGGGQSFLGGKFSDANGNQISPTVLNGSLGIFRFEYTDRKGVKHVVLLDDATTQYEIKPRAAGQTSMKLSVDRKSTPSAAIAAFLMLPKTCGIYRTEDLSASVLCRNNYWLQSMWMDVDASQQGKTIFTPKDCVFCGGIDKQRRGKLRCFSVDFSRRMADVVELADRLTKIDEIAVCLKHFASIYTGTKPFKPDESADVIAKVMQHLASKYPERYSGFGDPLIFIREIVQGYKKDETKSPTCLLDVALKCFVGNRQKREWCADALAENGGMPAVGYAANRALRGISITPQVIQKLEGEHPSHLKSWFNSFCDPKTNKSWIDGVSDADLTGLGPYIAHLLDETKPEVPWPQTLPLSLQKAIKTIADPEKCGMYDKRVQDVLKFFGRAEGEFNPAFTDDDYQDVLHEQRVIRKRLKTMGQKQIVEWDAANNQGKSNNEDPDFLTINEFLWWASDEDNQKKISKECEVKKMKAADYSTSQNQPTAKKAKVNLAKKEDVVLLRLCAALRAKPFAILAGHSGTGKSRTVRQLAYMTAAAHNHRALFEDANGRRLTVPGNFCMVQVKPNWHDSTDLLGYYSEMKGVFKGTDFVKFICRAYAYPDVPFFVCLDEMNLAPVEHYFAEYLSAIESRKLVKDVETMDENGNVVKTETVMTDRLLPDEAWRNSVGAPDYSGLGCEYNQSQCWLEKHGLTIPRNLFVVGTVNMDESTNQFTRKVLDRAFTLEMTDADFEHFGESDPEPTFDDFAGDDFADALLSGTMIAKKPEPTAAQGEQALFKKQIDNLTALKPVLDGTSFVVAYRFANEYMLYESAFAEMRKVMDVSSLAPAQQGTASANPAYEPEAFDDMILMKLLPRISGDQAVVMRIFVGESDPNKDSKKLDDADVGGLAKLLKQKGASFEKMQEIVRRGEANGGETLTFWP